MFNKLMVVEFSLVQIYEGEGTISCLSTSYNWIGILKFPIFFLQK